MAPQAKPYPSGDRWTLTVASALSVVFLAATIYISARRPIWFDEIVTEVVSRQSWPQGALQVLKTGVDMQPLPYYLFVKSSEQAFGRSGLALRLPSALGLFLGLWVIFDCTRRLTDGLYGLLALGVLTCSVLPYYGVEARPYALVFMWTACSLWLWLHTRRNSWAAALLFGLASFGSVISHYYAVFSLIPFGLATLANIRKEKLPPKLIAGAAGLVAGLAFMLPLIPELHRLGAGFWAQPSIGALEGTFAALFPHAFFLLPAMLILLVLCAPDRVSIAAVPMSAQERLAWSFLFIPLGGFLGAKFVSHAFLDRYFIGILPGIAVGFSTMAWRHFRPRWIAPAGMLCLLAGFGIARCASHVRNPDWEDPSAKQEIARLRELLQFEDVSLKEGKRYLVLPADSMLAIEILYHSPHPERYRLFNDPGSLTPFDFNIKRLAPFFDVPIHYWSLKDLNESAGEAALIEPPDKAMIRIERMGITFEFRPVETLFRVAYLHKV